MQRVQHPHYRNRDGNGREERHHDARQLRGQLEFSLDRRKSPGGGGVRGKPESPRTSPTMSADATTRVIGSANTMATTTMTPVTISEGVDDEVAQPPRRVASPAVQRPRKRRNKRRRHRAFGEQIADQVGDAEGDVVSVHRWVADAPNRLARTISRTTPRSRLAIVAMPMRPADRARRELIGSARRREARAQHA